MISARPWKCRTGGGRLCQLPVCLHCEEPGQCGHHIRAVLHRAGQPEYMDGIPLAGAGGNRVPDGFAGEPVPQQPAGSGSGDGKALPPYEIGHGKRIRGKRHTNFRYGLLAAAAAGRRGGCQGEAGVAQGGMGLEERILGKDPGSDPGSGRICVSDLHGGVREYDGQRFRAVFRSHNGILGLCPGGL